MGSKAGGRGEAGGQGAQGSGEALHAPQSENDGGRDCAAPEGGAWSPGDLGGAARGARRTQQAEAQQADEHRAPSRHGLHGWRGHTLARGRARCGEEGGGGGWVADGSLGSNSLPARPGLEQDLARLERPSCSFVFFAWLFWLLDSQNAREFALCVSCLDETRDEHKESGNVLSLPGYRTIFSQTP